MKNQTIDIAIVGGGVSGVYSAWKLKKKYPSKKIVVFEGGNHIGGRLLSVTPPNIPNMVAELGGMRILENAQPLIVALIKELNAQLPQSDQIELYDFRLMNLRISLI
ncbi:NAD(P)-binding protein [Pseudarcicella hirudinis]|uniref:NAD(P)-binding protein n=1 Tax=Pseudarcicella hirudinis TaxID=1079859 RepID=UPI0035EF8851